MNRDRRYFFCGIGGSGMLPLALIVQARGHSVAGSDRALDQGRTTGKFEFLRRRGIRLFPQDGSGVSGPDLSVVISTAVEDTVPDVRRAREVGAALITRAELLADLFNAAPAGIGVAGTSGKSTTTGMIGWMLSRLGRDPTIMNGAVMRNFVTSDEPFASARVGGSGLFVAEVDESDGSIARYRAKLAVLNNISLDHKSMDELRSLFRDFVSRSERAVLNLDNAESALVAAEADRARTRLYSLSDPTADLVARDIVPSAEGITFTAVEREGASVALRLAVPGRHNVSNALAALAAVRCLDIPLAEAAAALEQFAGIRRRLEIVGTADGVRVIDDFAHNPDKIAASLETLHASPGRLLVFFQPHGYGPLRQLRDGLIDSFAAGLAGQDLLVMPDPVYFGGTVQRTVTSQDVVEAVRGRGRAAEYFAERAACGEEVLRLARPGDRIVVMGARDDTLSQFAADLLARLAARQR